MGKRNKSNLEIKIGKYHHRLELIRTIIPIIMVFMQAIILYGLFHKQPEECELPHQNNPTTSVYYLDKSIL